MRYFVRLSFICAQCAQIVTPAYFDFVRVRPLLAGMSCGELGGSEMLRNGDGSAYGRPLLASDADKVLLQVGPGTSAGEWLRRYWHPIETSDNVTTTPKKVRVLGEDLILFRDGAGKPGLLEPHCH